MLRKKPSKFRVADGIFPQRSPFPEEVRQVIRLDHYRVCTDQLWVDGGKRFRAQNASVTVALTCLGITGCSRIPSMPAEP